MFGVWDIINELLLQRKKKIKKQIEEAPETKDLSPQEKNKLLAERLLKEMYNDLYAKAELAYRELKEKEDQLDPAIRAMLEEYRKTRDDYIHDRFGMPPGYMVGMIALREAIRQGLHKKDRKQFYQFLTQFAYQFSKRAAHEIPQEHSIGHKMEEITNPYKVLFDLDFMLFEARKHDKEAEEYEKNLYQTLKRIRKEGEESGVDFESLPHRKHPYHTLAEGLLEKYLPELKVPEEILGEKKEEEAGRGESPILERPDRYPAIIQKLLAIHHILKHHTRGSPALYRAIHRLLQSPYTAGPYGPLIDDYFETLEEGEKKSPLTHLLEKLDAPPKPVRVIKQYMKQLEEEGKSVEEAEGKEEFKEAMDQLISHIRGNPDRYARAMEELTHIRRANPGYLAEVLAGMLRDYRDLYSGERDPRSLDLDRDALQLHRLLRELPAGDEERDPGRLAMELRRVIEENIQDEETRKAYLQVLEHYGKTYTQAPRDPQKFRQWLTGKERELEDRLGEADPDLRRAMGNLYRILAMLSVGDSLRELKSFYNKYAEMVKKELGYYPQHGPIATDLARAFGDIREKKGEDWLREAKKKAALFKSTTGNILEARETALDIAGSEESLGRVPREKEELFTRRLKKLQHRLAE